VWLVSCCRVVTAFAAAIRFGVQGLGLAVTALTLTSSPQWLTRIRIFTSPNNIDWIDQGSFAGNNDQDSMVNVILSKPTVARYVRIEVVSVSNHASARWDVLKTADQSSLVLDQPKLLRANPSINQYTFSSCHGGDAPGSGHCRPQIDSPQVSWC
jgi:hypothetical protein